MNPTRIGIAIFCVLGVVLLAFWGYGGYQYYFKKPIPQIVYNITNAQPQAGGTVNITQPKPEEKPQPKQHLFFGFYGNQNTLGGVVGWLF